MVSKQAKEKEPARGEHITSRGVLKKARKPKDVGTHEKCRYNCHQNFPENIRQAICEDYWSKGDWIRQKDYIVHHIRIVEVARTNENTIGGNRIESRQFYLKNGEALHRTCKDFFSKTLCISNAVIDNALIKRSNHGEFVGDDGRGRKPAYNKTADREIFAVKQHIESFPAIESHYCRASTSRSYLDPNLTIKKMHKLFLEKCTEDDDGVYNNLKSVSEGVYRKIFCENYNLGFFKPKKDACEKCEGYTNMKNSAAINKENNKELLIELEERQKAHLKRKEEMRLLKHEVKRRAAEDPTFYFATFDLQSILQLPSSEASLLY